jgi:pimeloyl-ACP methyl ester carboxylesterase
MNTYVLVAGNLPKEAWKRLTARNDYISVWDLITPTLKAEGHLVFTPNLKDEKTYALSDQIEEVSQLILQNNLKNITLVGASYCGMVITGVASIMPDRIATLVYVDAILPKPGESVASVFKLADFIPKTPIDTFATYTEKLFFDPRKIDPIRKLYVLCTESNFTSVTTLAKERLNNQNWDYIELAASHLPMITHPAELTHLLLAIGKIE